MMNYKRIYDEFISDRILKQEIGGYFETHHILPKSLGGSDDEDNLIKLKASDHFFAHLLLARIYKGKMLYALRQMLNFKKSNMKDRIQYEYLRSNLKHSEQTKMKIRKSVTGFKHSDESKIKMSYSRQGENNPNYGKTLSNKTIIKLQLNSQIIPVDQFDLNDNFIQRFKSISSAARQTNTPRASISRVCQGIIKTSNNFKWRYAS